MNQKERIAKILELLQEKEKLEATELADYFQISKDSVRRDILLIVNEGLAERYRGGITLPIIKTKIEDYSNRLVVNSQEKIQIARKAVEKISADETIWLDVSTTVQFIAKELTQENVLIVTNSIDNAISATEVNKQQEVFLLGGYFNPNSHLLRGTSVMTQLTNFYFDIAFIGASGINEAGLFYSELEDIELKQTIIKNTKKTCVVIDNSKVRNTTNFKLDFSEIDLLITDKPLPETITAQLQKDEVTIILVEGGEK
ncbi:DeoR family transcriptional regulator, carbon catabolite repression regulator [Enterococcus sp. DIV0212c]|uniref:DeoR/GlpR family DNA-binding transcription regulator n=1 Tax=Enterococcus sp. DIV0212c TaxID=2230867 RepID=UPI001A9C25C9|nr:DeoR/GlpR family DNA-binding transcription regulator [Enterococcus sp. DIV0212c]MBO1354474.1 DeoR/GlpR transcriptional regulator [Enterococcus sp. DIV0212c]